MKTFYETFFKRLYASRQEAKLRGVSDAELKVFSYPTAPLFVIEDYLPQVKELVPISEQILPYPAFFLEYHRIWLMSVCWLDSDRFGTVGAVFLSVINGYIDNRSTFGITARFEDHNLTHLISRCSDERDHGPEYLEKLKELYIHQYWRLYDFLLYLKTPVVKKVSVDIPGKRRQISKENNTGEEFVKYTKVTIKKEYKQTVQSTSSDESDPSSKRFHWCRGHFKNYTEEKPLFGKVTGVIWSPPHTRGDAKKGVVFKSYQVKEGVEDAKEGANTSEEKS